MHAYVTPFTRLRKYFNTHTSHYLHVYVNIFTRIRQTIYTSTSKTDLTEEANTSAAGVTVAGATAADASTTVVTAAEVSATGVTAADASATVVTAAGASATGVTAADASTTGATASDAAAGATAAHTDNDIANMEPRLVLRGGTDLHKKFVEWHLDHMPDVSDRPDIQPDSVRFWTKPTPEEIQTGRRKSKKRFPAPHSRLSGMCGKRTNDALDFTMGSNKWCVVFKDEDGVTINLIDECIILSWLHYICKMVRIREIYCASTFNILCVYVKYIVRLRMIYCASTYDILCVYVKYIVRLRQIYCTST